MMKIVPMSHEEYLDLPGEFIQWMVRIDDLIEKIKAEREKAEQEQR